MKNYHIRQVSVNELQVDLFNPRLPQSRSFPDHRSVLDYLQDKEDILEIAESIADNGIFPSEPLIAVEEAGILSVIEGNRRLVAMKILANPNLATKSVRQFTALSTRVNQSDLQQLDVIVYDTRIAAAPVLIKRHTNDPAKIRQWEPIMKAHYTTSFLNSGANLSEISASLSIEESSLKDDLKLFQLYKLATEIPFDETLRQIIQDEKNFPLTNLWRAVNSSRGKQLISVQLDLNTNKLVLSFGKEEFLKPFTRLISDIATEVFNSRAQNTATQIDDYFNNYAATFLPDTSISGGEDIDLVITYVQGLTSLNDIYKSSNSAQNPNNADTATNSQNQQTSPAPSAPSNQTNSSSSTPSTTNPNITQNTNQNNTTQPTSTNNAATPVPRTTSTVPPSRKRKSIIYNDVNVVRNFTHQRITLIVKELKTIDSEKFKNSAGVLLRTLLDIVTHEFLKSLGEDVIMRQEAEGRRRPNQPLHPFWTPELKAMLTRITSNQYGLPRTTLSALNRHINDPNPANNVLFILNEIVHNPNYNFNKQNLLDIYDKLEPYLKEVL